MYWITAWVAEQQVLQPLISTVNLLALKWMKIISKSQKSALIIIAKLQNKKAGSNPPWLGEVYMERSQQIYLDVLGGFLLPVGIFSRSHKFPFSSAFLTPSLSALVLFFDVFGSFFILFSPLIKSLPYVPKNMS